jgi:hypothetical protein
MAKKTKYKKASHKRAFELYRELGSFYAVSHERGMPSQATLMRWSRPGFDCDCGFHGWEALEKQIKSDTRDRWNQERESSHATDETNQPDLEEFVRPDLEKLKINRMIEKQAFDAIKAKLAAAPDTLGEAMKIIHALWRQDRLIVGEGGGETDYVVHFDREDKEL